MTSILDIMGYSTMTSTKCSYRGSLQPGSGTICGSFSLARGVLGGPLNDVSRWDARSKVIEALRLTGPKLPKEMQAQFVDMLSPLNIGITVGVLVAWVASQAFGVGEVLDALLFIAGLVLIGPMIIQCAKDLARFVDLVQTAHNRSDLDTASFYLARVISVLGVTVFMAFLTKCASKGVAKVGAVQPPEASMTETVASAEVPTAPQRTYEVLLPADKVLQGDGTLAQAMRKAALDDWYRNYPSLDKWRKYNPVTKKFETAAMNRVSHMSGTDLSFPIIRRTLQPGTEIIQFQRIGGQLGVYLGYPNATPAELGILGKGRIVRRFRVVEPLEVLESTAAEFKAGRVSGVGGKGGGQQIIMPPDWERRVQKLW